MTTPKPNSVLGGVMKRPWLVFGACMLVVLAFLFRESFLPGKVHFSNDGPLGAVIPLAQHVFGNFLMRGVSLPAGEHRVEFRYEPAVKTLYVTLAALALAAVLVGCLLAVKPSEAPSPIPVSPVDRRP